MKDLLVSTHTPTLGSGQALRTYGIARALAAHGGLDLLYARFGASEPDEAFRSIPGIELHGVVPSRGLHRLQTYLQARLRGVPAGFAQGISPELSSRATEMAGAVAAIDRDDRHRTGSDPGEPHDSDPRQQRGSNPGEQRGSDPRQQRRVIADGPIAAAALWQLAGRRPVIYNAHNLESSFRHELRRAGLRGSAEASTLRSFERRLLARACESWMVSETDIAGARELCSTAHLRYVPNVVDVSAITPVTELPEEPRAIFVASFYYEPNRNGLRFLLEDVFPRVWAELPQARLALVGTGLEQPPSTDPRIETLGFVEDLAAVYASARCAVVPLLQGGGTPLKLIEALAHGLPVVATARAGAALQLRDGEHCLLADGGEAFAQALLRVMRAEAQEAPELGRHGRKLVEQRYSIEALGTLVSEH